ncbi:hypothetical protein NDU88_002514 [Pleurodeles waltl]|uniref:Uncharacterized protein n=1 Tax=Pleurodeles waltl TaxID=8319 RepID=A0AAV7P768_PLEWA|nr:hypothetical protein NDU88_002514 [Pleurodeles waltl]
MLVASPCIEEVQILPSVVSIQQALPTKSDPVDAQSRGWGLGVGVTDKISTQFLTQLKSNDEPLKPR